MFLKYLRKKEKTKAAPPKERSRLTSDMTLKVDSIDDGDVAFLGVISVVQKCGRAAAREQHVDTVRVKELFKRALIRIAPAFCGVALIFGRFPFDDAEKFV